MRGQHVLFFVVRKRIRGVATFIEIDKYLRVLHGHTRRGCTKQTSDGVGVVNAVRIRSFGAGMPGRCTCATRVACTLAFLTVIPPFPPPETRPTTLVPFPSDTWFIRYPQVLQGGHRNTFFRVPTQSLEKPLQVPSSLRRNKRPHRC